MPGRWPECGMGSVHARLLCLLPFVGFRSALGMVFQALGSIHASLRVSRYSPRVILQAMGSLAHILSAAMAPALSLEFCRPCWPSGIPRDHQVSAGTETGGALSKVTQLQSLILGDSQSPPVHSVCKQLPVILFPETSGSGSDLPAWSWVGHGEGAC